MSTFNPRNSVLLLIMVIVASLRLITYFNHNLVLPALFTPIGAMAIFGAAYFKGYLKPIAFPLLTLFISDVVLSFTVYAPFRSGLLYTGWYWTYGAFALMTLVGKIMIRDVRVGSVSRAVVAVTLVHWLVSDIGGCLGESSQGSFISVYMQRLVTAIPYELQFLAGTALYGFIMFGFFELMQRKFPRLAV